MVAVGNGIADALKDNTGSTKLHVVIPFHVAMYAAESTDSPVLPVLQAASFP